MHAKCFVIIIKKKNVFVTKFLSLLCKSIWLAFWYTLYLLCVCGLQRNIAYLLAKLVLGRTRNAHKFMTKF